MRLLITAPAACLLATGLAAGYLRRTFVVVAVQGSSMAPTLQDGERVVVRRRLLTQLRRGDVVVLRPPDPSGVPAGDPPTTGWNIKRVAALPGDPVPEESTGALPGTHVPPGSLVVLGDNSHSIDSRHRGFFSGERVLGKAVRRLGGAAL
ncbi:signal peptidase I [Streptomyces sp. N2-109]|uniref:Signal peptidase I n=1 Tax=Streptomyces gossypii TaxID=2883101 RepID=A0ABT2JSC5_9ACTN|nr:signal peptidase I [Streptomyces gossypii]MCT2590613.1 signal peptidase I [Streptomyces gossypii]